MTRWGAVLVLMVGGVANAAAQGVLVERLSRDEARPHLTADTVVVIAVGAQAKEHYYPAFRPFPGSTMVEAATARDYLADIVRSIATHGPRRFYVLNTGVSTIAPLRATQALLRLEGVEMRFTDILAVAADVEKRLSTQQGGTHADETETSLMLYIAPEVVKMPNAVKDYRRLRDQWPHVAAAGPQAATGVYGDPTLATRDKGAAIAEAMVTGILREIEDLRRATLP